MDLVVMVVVGLLVLPIILSFSVAGAYSRIRRLEEVTARLQREFSVLVTQKWHRPDHVATHQEADGAGRPEPAHVPAGEDAPPASAEATPDSGPEAELGIPSATLPAIPTSPVAQSPQADAVAAEPAQVEPSAARAEAAGTLAAEPTAPDQSRAAPLEPTSSEQNVPELAPQAAELSAAHVPRSPGAGEPPTSPPEEAPRRLPAGALAGTDIPAELPEAWRDRLADSPSFGRRVLGAAFRWLVTGNLVAKLGLVILFIGIAFLLKYVAAQIFIPIELRIAAVGIADIALLAWGWRIRHARRGIGLPVQGAAIAILMLLIFACYRMYALLPGGAAFTLLFVLTVFTCMLAVLQDALWLALFGIAGGFLAPILTSSGSGNHIALFSYYGLLDGGILAIALRRSWRSLNVVGFAFTSVIGVAWGISRYTPDDYLSAQCFLLLFFLFFTAISLVYAFRVAEGMNKRVDGLLVFGTPLIGAALQWALVRDLPFGPAFSALGGGTFYTGIALALWRRPSENTRLLVESFFAMGVVLGTLTIPLALEVRWTSAAWAVEGAALAFVGLRHGRGRMWVFGLMVQVGAWFAFLLSVGDLTRSEAAEAHLWLGFLILAASTGLMSRLFSRTKGAEPGSTFDVFGVLLLCIATGWLLASAWADIVLRTEGAVRGNLLVVTALVLSGALAAAAAQAGWRGARGLGFFVQMLAGVTLLIQIAVSWRWSWQEAADGRPLIGVLLITAAAFLTAWRMARTRDAMARRAAPGMLAWAALWWFWPLMDTCAAYVALWTGMETMPRFLPLLDLWPAYALCLAASSVMLAWVAPRLRWRSLRWLTVPCWAGTAVAMIEMLLELHTGLLPLTHDWMALAALLAAAEYLLHRWPYNDWRIGHEALLALHTVRSAGPWLMIWPLGFLLIGDWLAIEPAQRELLARAGWEATGSWARYLPLWGQMLMAGWLLRRARCAGWPVKPVPAWYGRVLLPLAAAWTILHVLVWNFTQDGAMAPLPYLPLANPLDLSTGFAIVMVLMLCRGEPGITLPRAWHGRLAGLGMAAVFAWLNLILLRSAAHWAGLPYRADVLFDSRVVQAGLSLMWSVAALVLMRWAARRRQRRAWLVGAAMLGIVVAKLFLVDLAGSGSMERIVSFVGVGLLMLAIGYLAPYPTAPAADRQLQEPEQPVWKGDSA